MRVQIIAEVQFNAKALGVDSISDMQHYAMIALQKYWDGTEEERELGPGPGKSKLSFKLLESEP